MADAAMVLGERELTWINMAESIQHMKLGNRDREIVKAAMRAAFEYDAMKRQGFSLKPREKIVVR